VRKNITGKEFLHIVVLPVIYLGTRVL